MDTLFNRTTSAMESWLLKIEQGVRKPVKVPFKQSFVYRYKEQTLDQALVQKLARIMTGLQSAHLLLTYGFFQEQASIQRMLEDFDEDVHFLANARLSGEETDLHKNFLDAFYMEEYDNQGSALDSTQKRPSIPRKKIRAYIANAEKVLSDPSTAIKVSRTMNKTYSGFLHGASPQIMDMYGGDPPRFQVSGMLGTPHENDHRQDLWNYFYRGLLSFQLVAHVLRQPDLLNDINGFLVEFEKSSGTDYMQQAKKENDELLNKS